jgi:hypothetical protein
MKHLQMDKESLLRKQVQDEIQSLFDSRLKEARRGKTLAEEELEMAAEKWRSERRRLNAEIDRLESVIAETKERQGKKARANSTATGIDPVEVARMRGAAEERFKKASDEWKAEKNRLMAQHTRLEKALAEAIERSNNPLRSTLQLTEQFEQKLQDAVRARQRAEEELRKAQREWAEEKLRFTGKMSKIRRNETGVKVEPAARNDDRQLKELQEKLTAAQSALQAERDQFEKEMEQIRIELRQAVRVRKQLEEKTGSLQVQIQESAAEHQRQIQQLTEKIADSRNQSRMESAERLAKEYDRKIQDLMQQKMDLSQELNAAVERLEAERTRAAGSAAEKNENPRESVVLAEVGRIEGLLEQVTAIINDPGTELSMVIRKNVEQAELNAYLRGILFSIGKAESL